MNIKYKQRVIKSSKDCRIIYGDPSSFDLLEITIKDGDDTYVYQIEANHLSAQVDSIRFYPKKENGTLRIQWVKWAEPYVRLVYSSK